MLPTIVLTVSYLLVSVELSPLYNMQPAYITANIGTTGRNIRNLPCISRKNSLSGVCMFAIDCFKSNGTHLGTCIDRFYFGSCCHIEPVSNEIDNNIEPALFPDKHREPPLRLSSTENPSEDNNVVVTTQKTTSSSSTTQKAISSTTTKLSTTSKVVVSSSSTQELRDRPTTNALTSTTTSTRKPLVTTTVATTTKPPKTTTSTTTTTKKPTITTTVAPTTVSLSTTTTTTTKTTPTTTTPLTTTKRIFFETTTRKPVILTKEPTTELNEAYKLTTFQSVDNEIQTTLKPYGIGNTIFKITRKPTPQVNVVTEETKEPVTVNVPLVTRTPSSPKPVSSSSTLRPVVTKTTQKPSRPTKPSTKPTRTKPSKPVSQKPISRPTVKPAQSKPTRRVTTTTVKPTKSTKPLVKISTTTESVLTTQKIELIHNENKETTSEATSFKPTSTEAPTKSTIPDKLEINATSSSTESSSSTPTTSQTTTTTLASSSSSLPTSSSTLSSSSTTSTTSTPQTVPSSTPEQLPMVTESPVGLFPMEDGLKVPEMATTPESNDILNMNLTSIFSEAVNGNTSTNEIESAKPLVEPTTKPSLVTWTGIFEEPASNTTDGDWVPITTPDGWVMLPSVSTVNQETSSPSSESAEVNEGVSSSSYEPPKEPSDAINATTSSPSGSYEEIPSTVEPSGNVVEEPGFNMTDYRDVCGRRIYPEARIVGGDNSSFGKWPWQISLRQWRTSTYLHKCGAALLSEYWAITAAHCVERVPPSDLLLRLGEYDLATELEPYVHQERRVQIVASHPQFDPRTFEYDLALLRFYEPVKFQPNILPVCVPQNDDDFIGTNAYVTGWGRLYEDGPLPNVLQEVRVPVINNTLCESMYRSAGYIEHIPHIFICAGWGRGGYDSCEGDSGGPMVIQREDKRFLLAGVISWGIGCAEPNQPGVYTRISEFRDWINQILQF